MNRTAAVARMSAAAETVLKKHPPKDPLIRTALRHLAWAHRNMDLEGDRFTAGCLLGIQLGAADAGRTCPTEIGRALFVTMEILRHEGEVPVEQTQHAIDRLAAYVPETERIAEKTS